MPVFNTIFVSFWIKFCPVHVHKNLLSNCEFHATWHSEIPTLLNGINELLLLLLLLLVVVVVVVVSGHIGLYICKFYLGSRWVGHVARIGKWGGFGGETCGKETTWKTQA